MDNEHLRSAITRAGLTLEEFADIVQVDVKTVQRWLAGRTPYPRLRSRAAGALDTSEHALWPDAVPPPPASEEREPQAVNEVCATYGNATESRAPRVAELLSSAVERVELVIADLASQPGIVEVLLARAADGCEVRVIIEGPDEHVAGLLGAAEIEVRASPGGEEHLLYRADEQMLLVLRQVRSSNESSPLLHLRRLGDGGLFDRLVDDFADRWAETTSLTDRGQLDADLAGTELEPWPRARPPLRAEPAQPVVPPPPEPVGQSAADPPRRWPGRRPN